MITSSQPSWISEEIQELRFNLDELLLRFQKASSSQVEVRNWRLFKNVSFYRIYRERSRPSAFIKTNCFTNFVKRRTLSRKIWFIFSLKFSSFEILVLNSKKSFFERFSRKRKNRFRDSEIISLFDNNRCADKSSFEHKFSSIKFHVSHHFFSDREAARNFFRWTWDRRFYYHAKINGWKRKLRNNTGIGVFGIGFP